MKPPDVNAVHTQPDIPDPVMHDAGPMRGGFLKKLLLFTLLTLLLTALLALALPLSTVHALNEKPSTKPEVFVTPMEVPFPHAWEACHKMGGCLIKRRSGRCASCPASPKQMSI